MVNTCGACGLAYSYTVLGWGDVSVLAFLNINFSVFIAAMSIVVLMMHGFLILRYYGLSKNRVVSLLLCIPALVACGGGLVVAWATAGKYNLASSRPKLRIFVTVVSSGSFGADACIAAAVMYELHRVTTTVERTQSLIRRLMRNSFLSGCATSVLALLNLIFFSKFPMANTGLIFSMNVSRTSAITVLYNLNDRRRARSELDWKQTSLGMVVHRIDPPQAWQSSSNTDLRQDGSDIASTTAKVYVEDIA
ncbi:hypothetical protein BKA62DRAFT_758857 [Auriculariales sp. MPI-PUGE-AT-0066]|nr:hypothetical protein BKA62DRAFT_758857 [Auriculariales sp. MPI-PUGE-AT-0066]